MPFSKYLPEHMGSIRLTPPGPFVAGSLAELTLTYTAGTFGIDDTGMVKISWRTTSDMGKPQFDKPAAPNFTTVEASNGAKLDVWFDRLNIRPYANTLLIRVGRGYLRAGDLLAIGHQPQLKVAFSVGNQILDDARAVATSDVELHRQAAKRPRGKKRERLFGFAGWIAPCILSKDGQPEPLADNRERWEDRLPLHGRPRHQRKGRLLRQLGEFVGCKRID